MSATDPAPGTSSLAAGIAKALVVPTLSLFLVPLVTVGLTTYGQHQLDRRFEVSLESAIDRDYRLDPAERTRRKAYFAAHPFSTTCAGDEPELRRYRELACQPFSEGWQLRAARLAGWAAAAVGLATLLAIGVLGLLAYARPATQYWTFMVGWRLLQAVTALETVAQGALLVWLSYWGTALLAELYYPKLIAIAAVVAAGAVWVILRALFRRVPPPSPLEAETVRPEDAPALWKRLEELAARLGTEPPRVMAAGIDDNFFVTEVPLKLTDGTGGGGRLLFVSLPLLRTLTPGEAEAVLAHELAHFKGGDTTATARLAPALVRYEAYQAALGASGFTVLPWLLMRLYHSVFTLALNKERRARELRADAEAARLTSADDLGRALLKVAGYSDFRARTEKALFEQRGAHQGELAIQARVAAGLPTHAASAAFHEHLSALRVPHPFDSHPPLQERLQSVSARVAVADAAGLLQAPPASSWAEAVLTGPGIEARLWGAYEARFKEAHEESLAWRYRPSTDEERALVVRHFPEHRFAVKDGVVVLSHLALIAADGTVVRFSEVSAVELKQGTFSSALVLTLTSPGGGKDRTFTLKLGPLGKEQERFKALFSRYWQRDQVSRQAE